MTRHILLTGATGAWGRATLRAFRGEPDVRVRAFVRDPRADRAVLAEFADMANLEVVAGDLRSAPDVARAVAGVDLILHLGAVVSPLADRSPDLAWEVNVGSIEHLIAAVRAQPDPAAVGIVGVGTVAEVGHRPAPHHWGRIGDPVRASRFDEYAQTKIVAERLLVDSGLPRWAWLRQSGMFSPATFATRDPIVMHTPLDGVIEWVSDVDSARLLVGLTRDDVPDAFWNTVHNVGAGEGWRLTNWQFQKLLAGAMGVADLRTWYERNWFATGNFHGHYYTDSDALEALVPFRGDTFPDALARAVAATPWLVRSAGRLPGWVVKHFVMGPLARRPRGTIAAIRSGDADAIAAHFGSLEAWQAIGDWSAFVEATPSLEAVRLDHGYDEALDPASWDAADYAAAAAFRGGELVAADVTPGDLATPLAWRCAFGHAFDASPRLVLHAGHWCPTCVRDWATYPRQAERSRFLAQVEPPAL